MSKSNTHILEVQPLGAHRLRVKFGNERTFEVDFSALVHRLKGLRPLRETSAFAQAHVGEGGFSIAWPRDLDVGVDRVLELALEQNGRSDAVEFIRWRWKHGLSLTVAAEALGLSRRQVAYYASGEHEVPRTVLLACKGWECEHAA
jgi:hypothetical protein